GDPSLVREAMTVALVVLFIGLVLAGVAAAIGVAAATVSQHELTRWVAYKLRGSAATAGGLQNPGPTMAAANKVTPLARPPPSSAAPACRANDARARAAAGGHGNVGGDRRNGGRLRRPGVLRPASPRADDAANRDRRVPGRHPDRGSGPRAPTLGIQPLPGLP